MFKDFCKKVITYRQQQLGLSKRKDRTEVEAATDTLWIPNLNTNVNVVGG